MKDAILRSLPITYEMRKEFVFVILSRIKEMMQSHERIVVSQAMRKLIHREIFLKELGVDISFVFLTAPNELIDARLENRAVGISKEYAALLCKDFDIPPEGTLTLHNDSDDLRIISQLNSFFN
jgi:gluconate kinase